MQIYHSYIFVNLHLSIHIYFTRRYAYEASDEEMSETKLAEHTVATIHALEARQLTGAVTAPAPFFVAVGFHKPHGTLSLSLSVCLSVTISLCRSLSHCLCRCSPMDSTQALLGLLSEPHSNTRAAPLQANRRPQHRHAV